MAVINATKLKSVLKEQTTKVFDQANAKVAVVGVSGGVNSALALGVVVDALGPENVAAVYMGAHSSPVSLTHARAVAKSQGVKLIELDVTNDVDNLWTQFRSKTESWPELLDRPKELRLQDKISQDRFQAAIVARGSLRSCIRATLLDSYGKAFALKRAVERGDNNTNVLIMGTGDEGEDRFFRFFNKRGDGAVDVSLLSGLSKNEHRQAAVLAYNIPREQAYQKSGPDLQFDVLLPHQQAHIAEEEMSRQFGAILTYGTIDPKTDKYATYGSLEWIARLEDAYQVISSPTLDYENLKKDLVESSKKTLRLPVVGKVTIHHYASSPPITNDQQLDEMLKVVQSARKFERATQHKTANQATINRKVFLKAEAIKDGPEQPLPVSFEL